MPLKLKKSQTPSEPSSVKDELSGPWGRINPEPQSVIALRFCKKTSSAGEETISYPYRVLSCWHWTRRPTDEELKIEASSDLITIKGRGLDRLVEALDQNALEILRETQTDIPSAATDWISVSDIDIETPVS